MKNYSESYRFEEAQLIKSKIEILEKYRSKSTIVNQKINNVDVFSIVEEEGLAFVNYLKVVGGAIVQLQTARHQSIGTIPVHCFADLAGSDPEIAVLKQLSWDGTNLHPGHAGCLGAGKMGWIREIDHQ